MIRLGLLVEGQTEEEAVNQIFAPHFLALGIDARATRIVTREREKRRVNRGGVTTFDRIERDLRRLLPSFDKVTTMFDLYALPSDWPGRATIPAGVPGSIKAEHLENALSLHFDGDQRLIPFLLVHELEGLLFTSPEQIADGALGVEMAEQRAVATASLQEVRAAFPTPEEIDEGPTTAPSKRIEKVIPSYRKRLHGPDILRRIGVAEIRAACPHFDRWFRKIEALGPGPAGSVPSSGTSPGALT